MTCPGTHSGGPEFEHHVSYHLMRRKKKQGKESEEEGTGRQRGKGRQQEDMWHESLRPGFQLRALKD